MISTGIYCFLRGKNERVLSWTVTYSIFSANKMVTTTYNYNIDVLLMLTLTLKLAYCLSTFQAFGILYNYRSNVTGQVIYYFFNGTIKSAITNMLLQA